jgi:transposase
LLFQPTYCPELDPVERVWQYLKRRIKTLQFNSLEDLRNQVADCLNNLSKNIIHSLTGWQHILDALSL